MSDYTSEYSKQQSNSVSLHIEYDMEKAKQMKDGQNKRKSVQAAINEANLLEDGGLDPYRKIGMHVFKQNYIQTKAMI